MSRLFQEKLNVKSVKLGKESTLPMLWEVEDREDVMRSDLPEGDGLFLRYRFIKSAFPYRAQDNYTRELTGGLLDGIILENEYLRASFTPNMGGKLWSLYDKQAGKELLFANPVARPAFLATRNAWCSGGVEWNCGIFGHTPFTCSPLFAARLTAPDGTPVLRMYEYERVRGVVYQMDFSLPDGSKVLYARMRVFNPSFRETTMYWWSNIGVPYVPGARVVVPAESAYTPVGEDAHPEDKVMSVVPIPVRDGIDVTYPERNPISVDYFFRTDPKRRMYTCQLSPEGYGLFECSTARLQGRKIFVWGQGPGGRKWQEYLSGEGSDGKYCEIQCGLAHTQSECLPMPPRTAWEWAEIYGPMQADPGRIHGEWDGARAEVEARIDDVISREALEKWLEDTRELALQPAEELLWRGAGWGALENRRRAAEGLPLLPAHLDFGEPGDDQAAWLQLLETGSMGDHDPHLPPASWMRQREWTKRMERAAEGADRNNWYTLLQLGCTYLAKPDLMRADHYISRSLEARWTAWGVYALAELRRIRGERHRAAMTMVEAATLAPEDASLAKMTARALHLAGDYQTQLQFTGGLSEKLRELPRIRLFRAFALAWMGDADGAEALLRRDGQWLEVPDVQEGEVSLSELWVHIQELRAKARGEAFDRDSAVPPYELDFRMFAE